MNAERTAGLPERRLPLADAVQLLAHAQHRQLRAPE